MTDSEEPAPDSDPVLTATLASQADLERLWTRLMSPLGFRRRSIWLALIDGEGRPIPGLVEIADTDEVPGPEEQHGLVRLLRAQLDELTDGAGRWAFLLSRPGGATVQPLDRALAAALVDACRDAGIPTEVVHLATDVQLVPLPYDELARSA